MVGYNQMLQSAIADKHDLLAYLIVAILTKPSRQARFAQPRAGCKPPHSSTKEVAANQQFEPPPLAFQEYKLPPP